MTTGLTPSPVQHFDDNNGNPASGYQVFTYIGGTTTKQSTYTDQTGGTANTDPIILNSRGEANIWLPFDTAFKFVLAPPTDTDPPTNPIWTVDEIFVGSLGNQNASNIDITGGAIIDTSFTDNIEHGFVTSQAELDITSNTTLGQIPNLSIPLIAAGAYVIGGHLAIQADSAGGLLLAFVESLGLTLTSLNINALALDGTSVVANTTITAIASNLVALTGVITDVYLSGSLVVNAAGTLNLQAAQNASDATSTKVFVNSTLTAVRAR